MRGAVQCTGWVRESALTTLLLSFKKKMEPWDPSPTPATKLEVENGAMGKSLYSQRCGAIGCSATSTSYPMYVGATPGEELISWIPL